MVHCWLFFFFFNDTATPEIYTLSLHDALPIYDFAALVLARHIAAVDADEAKSPGRASPRDGLDRKSTRLNSSHQIISYAVFCLKKKKTNLFVHELLNMNLEMHLMLHSLVHVQL